MTAYIIYAITALITGYLFYRNRKDLGESMKTGDSGFSARKLIAFQLMILVFFADSVYVFKFYKDSVFADKIYLEWINTHLIYVMFVLGFLSFPEIIKLINTIRGNPVKEEGNKKGE